METASMKTTDVTAMMTVLTGAMKRERAVNSSPFLFFLFIAPIIQFLLGQHVEYYYYCWPKVSLVNHLRIW